MTTSFVWEVFRLYRKFSTMTNMSYSWLACVSLVTFFSSSWEEHLFYPWSMKFLLTAVMFNFEEKVHFEISIHTSGPAYLRLSPVWLGNLWKKHQLNKRLNLSNILLSHSCLMYTLSITIINIFQR